VSERYWSMPDEALLDALRRVADGEHPDMVHADMLADSGFERVEAVTEDWTGRALDLLTEGALGDPFGTVLPERDEAAARLRMAIMDAGWEVVRFPEGDMALPIVLRTHDGLSLSVGALVEWPGGRLFACPLPDNDGGWHTFTIVDERATRREWADQEQLSAGVHEWWRDFARVVIDDPSEERAWRLLADIVEGSASGEN
jgi:hypothetical protein